MNKSVAVNIVFNTKTGEVVAARGELNKLANATDKANAMASKGGSAFSSLGAGIGKLAGIAGIAVGVAALTNAIKNSLTSAISLEAQTERLKASITSLVYVNAQSVSSTGELLNAQEKWNLSLTTSQKLTDDLSESAAKLGVGIDEMAAVYKSFAATGMSNMAFEDTTKAVELLSIAAQTGGTQMNELVRVIDSVGSGMLPLTGTYGKFLQAQGLSNEAMKEAIAQGKFYELLLEKLGPLQETTAFTSNTYAASVAKLNSAWNNLKSEAVKRYFENIKASINEITRFLNAFKDSILLVIDFVVEKASACWDGIKAILSAITDTLGELISFIASLFSDATKEMSAFEIALRAVGSICDFVAWNFQTLANAIRLIVEGIKGALNALQTAYYNTKDFFNLTDDEDKAKMQKLIAERAAGAHKVREIWDKQVDDTKNALNELEKTWTTKERAAAEKVSKTASTKGGIVQNTPATSPALDTLQKSTKAQIDTLKSWWETEFTLREKNIEFMRAGKDKELAAEKLRFDKVVSNLNFEIQKKLQSGEISLEQANALYAVEERAHEAKMRQIAEYSEAYENLRRNIDNALEENIANALTGKFSSTKDFFKDLFDSMQTSFTQGLAQSMAQAIMSAEVMESFTKTFSTAIEGVSSLFGGAEGGIANVAGANEQSTFTQGFGSALAGAVTGYSFGNMVYNSMNAGYTSKGDKWRNAGIGASALAGGSAGAYVGSAFGPWGTAIGGLIGGVVGGISSALGFAAFGQKLEQTGQGIQLWSKGTKDSLNASLYADMKETTKKWWKKSTKEWTQYYAADEVSLRSVRSVLASYEYLLEDIGGGVKEISIAAGRYNDYVSLANTGAKALINAFLSGLNVDTNAIYSVWASYASSVNKSVSEALSESLQKYVDTGNTFEAWKLEFEGKSAEALKLQANLANKQVDRLLETLGANDITIDNYLNYREQALRQSFDPQTIENINALGEYLMNAAQASKKYEEALKEESKTKLNLIDPFLNKAKKVDEIQTSNADTSEKLLVQILSTLKQTLRLNQESQEFALQTQAVRVF